MNKSPDLKFDTELPGHYSPGDVVVVKGVQGQAFLNGQEATVVAYLPDLDRWQLQFDNGQVKNLKA